MTPPDTAPLTGHLTEDIAAQTAAVDATTVIGEVPFNATVTGVTFTPEANVTGDATNNRVLTLVNKGSDGNGTTVVATLTFGAANNANDFDEKDFVLSAVAGAVDVAQGDILAVVETHGGTGLANPGGRVDVAYSRR